MIRRKRRDGKTRFRFDRDGQVLLLSVVLLAVVFGLVGGFVSYLNSVRKSTNVFSARSLARQAAQAGLEKAHWCLNQSSGTNCSGTYGAGFTGETSASLGNSAYYTTTIETLNSSLKTITSTGYYPSAANPLATVKIRVDATITTTSASFFYGVQTGNGGFTMGNNAYVQGNIYANGDVVGQNGAYATGDVWVAGGTGLTPDQSSAVNNEDYTFGKTSPQIDIAQSFKISQDNVINKLSFYVKKEGSPTDRNVYILADNNGVPSQTILASTLLNASNVTTDFGWVDVTFDSPPGLVGNERYWWLLDAGTSSTKYWIIGSQPNSGYGNGQGMVSGDWDAGTPVWADATRDYNFKVWTGGVVTRIENVDVQHDAHANTIKDLAVTNDAWYQTLTDSTVGGASHPGSADPGPEPLPLSDGQIDQWKTEAAAGGTITGDVTYDGTSNSLGPKKITGNLTVTNNAVLTVTGTLYVQGTITLSNNATVALDPGYGANSGMLIGDGKIIVNNNVAFQGSGTTGSYVLVLSTDTSLDVLNPALDLNNNSANSIFYASKGVANIKNNTTLKEVTAFKLNLENNAAVLYESGLANINFSSGPGGNWTLKAGTVREIR